MQLLFVDKTSMTIGPNSDLTIDEYVYDPNAGSGKLAATLGKGALRFVGGQISHTGDAEIKTASAMIGIRGGVALIGTQSRLCRLRHLDGDRRRHHGDARRRRIHLAAGGGQPPSPPGPPPPNFVLSQIQLFQSGSGQTGGAAQGTASPATSQRAETRATGTPGGSVAGPLTPPPPPPPVRRSPVASTLNQTIQTSTQQRGVQQTEQRQVVGRPSMTLAGFVGGLMQSATTAARPCTRPSTGTGAGRRARRHATSAGAGQFQRRRRPRPEHRLPAATSTISSASTDPCARRAERLRRLQQFRRRGGARQDGKPLSTIDGMPITDQTGAMSTVTREQARQYATGTATTT